MRGGADDDRKLLHACVGVCYAVRGRVQDCLGEPLGVRVTTFSSKVTELRNLGCGESNSNNRRNRRKGTREHPSLDIPVKAIDRERPRKAQFNMTEN